MDNKLKALIISVLSIFLLSGCATALLTSMQPSYERVEHVRDKDTIRYIAKTETPDAVQSDVVLVGDKYLYQLDKETLDDFFLIIKVLNPEFIKLKDPIRINQEKNNQIYVGLDLAYDKLGDVYSEEENMVFEKLDCKTIVNNLTADDEKRKHKYCYIKLTGHIYKKGRIDNIPPTTLPLQLARNVKIVSYNSKVTGDTFDKLFYFPLTLSFDIVTLPAQLLFGLWEKNS